jgi:hypothetical protein
MGQSGTKERESNKTQNLIFEGALLRFQKLKFWFSLIRNPKS